MIEPSKHITVLVSNDLEFDQRVAKVCTTLLEQGYSISLVGVLKKQSRAFSRDYQIVRLRVFFSAGALFYVFLQIRLFFFLLFKRTDAILANDLDTLLPAFLISKLRGKILVYDSHEYFTEAEGLTGRRLVKAIWTRVEQYIFPKLQWVYTVNESIAEIYRKRYKVDVGVVRNVPFLKDCPPTIERPKDRSVKQIILQGAYLDPDRGGKEAVDAMSMVQHARLLIVGSGREMPEIRKRAGLLHDRVEILGKLPFSELRKHTANSDIGLSLDKPLHDNYRLSLPNKLFDYIHCGVPVIGSDLPELKRIIEQYKIGWLVKEITPSAIADAINHALSDEQYDEFVENCLKAREELCWEKEGQFIIELFRRAFSKYT